MRTTAALALALVLPVVVAGCGEASAVAEAGPAAVRLAPSPAAVATDVPRFGLNLGGTSTWGAEQLVANALKNPGFEAPLEGSLVVVRAIVGDAVLDDTPWVARGDGLWTGAQYEVLSGAAAGRRGRVRSYRRAAGGAGEFELDPFPAGVRQADALAVRTVSSPSGVPQWWSNDGDVRLYAGEARPGGAGSHAAKLTATRAKPARLAHHLDMLERAGKLLPVSGEWTLAFWARSETPGTRLAVAFRRHGSPAFLARELVLDRQWRRYAFAFTAADDGPLGSLELSFEVHAGDAFLDDAYLGEATPGPGGFRQAAVDMLRTLRPGYLRDWQGQLADSFDNRVADAGARRPSRHRPGEAELVYGYGLPEFLELCAAVGARPWVVAPPLLGEDEWQRLGQALAAAAARHGFDEILVEFGNENWNEIFRPAGFMHLATHAEAADRAFAGLRRGAGAFRGLVPVAGAQFVDPAAWQRLATLAREPARIAVAPYFLYRLEDVGPDEAAQAAFADSLAPLRQGAGAVRSQGKGVAVYEVNFHTTEGAAPPPLRNLAVAGAHGGAALANQMLASLLAGVREQAAYTLAGFDAYTADRQLVRLWGLARDLAPGRLRPTGLALQMLNAVAGGDVHASACTGDGAACGAVTAAWFRQASTRALAVVSRDARSRRVHTGIACDVPVSVQLLDGSDPARNNEAGEGVRIAAAATACGTDWSFVLPGHSLAVLRAGGTGDGGAR